MTATVAQCVIRVSEPETTSELVSGRLLLGWLLREFTRYGVSEFLLLGHRVPLDRELSLPRRAEVTLFHTASGSSAADALLDARDRLQQRFLFCDGCVPFHWNLSGLLSRVAGDDQRMVGWIAATKNDPMIAVFKDTFVEYLNRGCALEAQVLPALAKLGLLGRPYIPHPDLDGSERGISGLRRKALFLDRDGVLNIDHGYVGSRDRFDWVDGALDAIRYATQDGWHVFIVTNQSGVARGLYNEDQVRRLLEWMGDQARAAGGTIDDFRFCPFHPDAILDAYRQAHPWRKPQPGMLLDLIRAWELDPEKAVMIGDQDTDMAAAAAAGVKGYLFAGGNLLAFLRPILEQHDRRPDPELTAF